MYFEHPFNYDGVYYAKVDGELIEITKEQATVMATELKKRFDAIIKEYMEISIILPAIVMNERKFECSV